MEATILINIDVFLMVRRIERKNPTSEEDLPLLLFLLFRILEERLKLSRLPRRPVDCLQCHCRVGRMKMKGEVE